MQAGRFLQGRPFGLQSVLVVADLPTAHSCQSLLWSGLGSVVCARAGCSGAPYPASLHAPLALHGPPVLMNRHPLIVPEGGVLQDSLSLSQTVYFHLCFKLS